MTNKKYDSLPFRHCSLGQFKRYNQKNTFYWKKMFNFNKNTPKQKQITLLIIFISQLICVSSTAFAAKGTISYSLRSQQDAKIQSASLNDLKPSGSNFSLQARKKFFKRFLILGIGSSYSTHKIPYERDVEEVNAAGELVTVNQQTQISYSSTAFNLRMGSRPISFNLTKAFNFELGLESWAIAGTSQRRPLIIDYTDVRLQNSAGTISGFGFDVSMYINYRNLFINLGVSGYNSVSIKIKNDRVAQKSRSVIMELGLVE